MRAGENSNWHEFFFGVAMMAASRSKDPRCQNGACITKDNMIIGSGYNGFVSGIREDEERWEREQKHDFVIHAERNAIYNCQDSPKGARMYLWSSGLYLPCIECAKAIAQSGIGYLYLMGTPDPEVGERYNWDASMSLLEESGLHIETNHNNFVSTRGILSKVTNICKPEYHPLED